MDSEVKSTSGRKKTTKEFRSKYANIADSDDPINTVYLSTKLSIVSTKLIALAILTFSGNIFRNQRSSSAVPNLH